MLKMVMGIKKKQSLEARNKEKRDKKNSLICTLLPTVVRHINTKMFLFSFLQLGKCVHFVIDVVDEILILFENAYEIYGDIKGASNSFNINAYEQGKKLYY